MQVKMAHKRTLKMNPKPGQKFHKLKKIRNKIKLTKKTKKNPKRNLKRNKRRKLNQ